MSHVDEGLLHAYLDGALPPGTPERRELEAHLGVCADCRVRLDDARRTKDTAQHALDAASTDVVPSWDTIVAEHARREAGGAGGAGSGPARRRPFIPMAWAASVVLALGAGFMGRAMLSERGMLLPEAPASLAPVEEGAADVRQEAAVGAPRPAESFADVAGNRAATRENEEKRAADPNEAAAVPARAPVLTPPPPAQAAAGAGLASADSLAAGRDQVGRADVAKASAEPPVALRAVAEAQRARGVALDEAVVASRLEADADSAAGAWVATDLATLAERLGVAPVTVEGLAPDSVLVAEVGGRILARSVYAYDGQSVTLLQRRVIDAPDDARRLQFRESNTRLRLRDLEVTLSGTSPDAIRAVRERLR